jgi:CheY-like chemotaxis protein
MTRLVLLIDDDPDEQLIMERALDTISPSAIGEYLIDSRTIEHRLDTGDRPTLILVDLSMPVRSGIETIRAIRAHPTGASLRVVAYSTSASPQDRSLALGAGADRYLTKPDSVASLAVVLSDLLSHLPR